MEITTTRPGDPAVWFGRARLDPRDPIVAGNWGTWRIHYTAGRYGIDNGGRLKVSLRLAADWSEFQTTDPKGEGYVTVTTTGAARVAARVDPFGHYRPWFRSIVVQVFDGDLAEGDQVTVTIGDTSGGGLGARAQTFVESRHEFRVTVECFQSGEWAHVPGETVTSIVSGPPHRLMVLGPSQVVRGERFALTVKAEDEWGNPCRDYRGTVRFEPVDGAALPGPYTFGAEDRGIHRFEGLVLARPGFARPTVVDAERGWRVQANPVQVLEHAPPFRIYWGDIHGQTDKTVGTGSVEEYFAYARDAGALDYSGHNGNDFQITAEHYAEIGEHVKGFHRPGRFVTFPGYEWSGNTPAGGDHNVFWLHDGMPAYRSSHWCIPDRSDEHTDRYPVTELYQTLKGKPALVIPHVGGRPCNLTFHEPSLEPVVEIASVHGHFEWLLREALERGYRVGVVCNSDDHTGRPGATYGTSSHFGVRGGLTGCYARELTREAIWEAYFARRTCGTTGERIFLWMEADGHPMGAEFAASRPPAIRVVAHGTRPLERVEIFRGQECVYTHPLVTPDQFAPGKVRVTWGGARIKGRGRHTTWHGGLTLSEGRITAITDPMFHNRRYGVIEQGERHVRWQSITFGNRHGFTLSVDVPPDAAIRVETPPARVEFTLGEVERDSEVFFDCGGVGQHVRAARVPAGSAAEHCDFTFRDDNARAGVNAYWVRVIQADGETAWSSPIYVHLRR
ncbi:MAG: hypothetical protein HY660_04230 [Armatimonadetes bacterium]|nr:hypothetical protein [Armatimonadota bacterium]